MNWAAWIDDLSPLYHLQASSIILHQRLKDSGHHYRVEITRRFSIPGSGKTPENNMDIHAVVGIVKTLAILLKTFKTRFGRFWRKANILIFEMDAMEL
ncbi:hypothetical protein CEXT_205851 [Caerostris extrusa]|uniref:Uncharacterized protein n=1 Tax=Caerostris extrusa TaxID=172846 RepID=A0AAV4TUS0_CAEEX|nr:hypothetical protein CEXT_205851 [Caerostris extrusa]